ncbi:3-oxoacyl-ACP synthase [Roseivirga sp.]|uniref:3-oxoacyl-ACP synthase n=1 Tax=Roseivirga sp. TaxID=1964215 RepID=UPI003B8C5C32
MRHCKVSEIKKKLYSICLEQVEERIENLHTEMSALKESAESDTKSSMGDKYETGREMINLEKGKIDQQLGEAVKARQLLRSLELDRSAEICGLGSLVTTSTAAYFIATSMGKFSVEGQDYFVISPMSPIGQQLLNKRKGNTITFAGRQSEIKSVS